MSEIIKALEKYENDGIVLKEDATFLRNVLTSFQIESLLHIHHKLNDINIERNSRRDYISICIDIMSELENSEEEQCVELLSIMSNPYFRSLIEAHDNIVYETYKEEPSLPPLDMSEAEEIGPPIRVVGLTKCSKEPLGIHLARHMDNCIYIKRILPGTMVDRQGLLNIGDIIKEINGGVIGTDPAKIEESLNSMEGDITIKVIPAFKGTQGNCQVFLRCQFDYNPFTDDQFPKDEVGLSFQCKDIIQIVDQSDEIWWQAVHLEKGVKTGLVPSIKFEQMRQTYFSRLKGKKAFKGKKKIQYRTSEHKLFDCLDMQLYEEVTKMPAMERKVIVLVGTEGIGRRMLKQKLIQNYPHQYGTPLADTCRELKDEEISGRGYNYVNKDEMLIDIATGKYLEWGEYNGNFYGTKLDSIRDVINAGKVCVLDCNPSGLKLLKTAEFMPLIVFIDAPSVEELQALHEHRDGYGKSLNNKELEDIVKESANIKNMYRHYFDLEIVNDNHEKTYNRLRENIENLSLGPQWVPVSWVY